MDQKEAIITDKSNKPDAYIPYWDACAAGWRDATISKPPSHTGPSGILMDLARIEPGQRTLDLASGTGEPALAIAQRVGPQGHVTALDASQAMLKTAQDRAVNLGLENMEFHVGPMESLPFEDDSFDVVTCRFGLMLADEPLAALKEISRVLAPGGRLAVMVHGPRDRNTQHNTVRGTALKFFGRNEDNRSSRRFSLSGEGELTRLFKEAGFQEIEEKEVSEIVIKQVGEVFWTPTLQRAFADDLAEMSADQRKVLDAQIAQAMESYIEDGVIHLLSTERVATGVA
jgi:ubiquinone/menaquinone biosynthesis C-methylase UbiE